MWCACEREQDMLRESPRVRRNPELARPHHLPDIRRRSRSRSRDRHSGGAKKDEREREREREHNSSRISQRSSRSRSRSRDRHSGAVGAKQPRATFGGNGSVRAPSPNRAARRSSREDSTSLSIDESAPRTPGREERERERERVERERERVRREGGRERGACTVGRDKAGMTVACDADSVGHRGLENCAAGQAPVGQQSESSSSGKQVLANSNSHLMSLLLETMNHKPSTLNP